MGLLAALDIWKAAVESVEGENATRRALKTERPRRWQYVLAVGKAASAMLMGVKGNLSEDARILLVTKYQHTSPLLAGIPGIRVIESGHPMPDQSSLLAGQAAMEFIASIPPDAELLVLVSGGASALVESLSQGIDLDQLQCLSQIMLGEGYSIDQINYVRIAISRVKGGKLLNGFPGSRVRVYGLSDIPGDNADLIGSGIGAIAPPVVTPFDIPASVQKILQQAKKSQQAGQVRSKSEFHDDKIRARSFDYEASLVGSNGFAREAAADKAKSIGFTVVECEECLNGDIFVVAAKLANRLRVGKPGVYIWGGEPTVNLPPNPGQGGRNQSLALALALEIEGLPGISGVVAGTDGSDGPTEAAGGMISSDTPLEGAADALARADAGNWLEQSELLLTTGPTGTNVMDLAIIIKSQSRRSG